VTEAKAAPADGAVVVTAVLRNDGACDTDDVLQVYCQNEGSANAPRNPRLCAFKRVHVPAGKAVTVDLTVDSKAFAVVDEQGRRVSEGKVVLYVGMGQPDTRTEALTGHTSVKLALS
jgi:beta-glucosidase